MIQEEIGQSFKTLNPLIGALKERHNSVALRHKIKAENQSLHYQASNMRPGLQDVIYGGSKNQDSSN